MVPRLSLWQMLRVRIYPHSVHHEPLTSFAPLAVFLFTLYCLVFSRFAACARWAAGRDFCYVFIASFSGYQTNYHKSHHNNICLKLDFSWCPMVFSRLGFITNRITSTWKCCRSDPQPKWCYSPFRGHSGQGSFWCRNGPRWTVKFLHPCRMTQQA